MDNIEELRVASLVADKVADEFHANFDEVSREVLERARESLLEGPGTCTRESFVAQIILNEMFADPLDNENTSGYEALTMDNKKALVEIAHHIGPNWAQALYRAAVFITKVA